MKKEEIVYVVGVLRKTVQERRKMSLRDADLIVQKLSLINSTNVEEIKDSIDDFIRNKIYYFERKNNKLKIEEYQKISKRNFLFFEFFMSNKERFVLKSQ